MNEVLWGTHMYKNTKVTFGEDYIVSESEEWKEFAEKAKNPTLSASTLSAADELKKYKDLFDSGTITQEEFNAKKKQLLNL